MRPQNKQLNFIKMAYKINPDLCAACGTCAGECPQEAISEGAAYSINPDLCIECGACADDDCVYKHAQGLDESLLHRM